MRLNKNDIEVIERLCKKFNYECLINEDEEAFIKSKYDKWFIVKEQNYYSLYHISIMDEFEYHLQCRKKVVRFLIERIQRHDRHLETHGRGMARMKRRHKN